MPLSKPNRGAKPLLGHVALTDGLGAWSITRRTPYTEAGIKRLKCIRCGGRAQFQWQICSDGNNYRPLCGQCDVLLNRMVLQWMGHPEADELAEKYAASNAPNASDNRTGTGPG